MDINDLKVIWNQQNDQPLYVLDPDTLHRNVRKRTGSIEQSVGIFEFVMMGVLVFVAAMAVGRRLLTSERLDGLDWITVGLTCVVTLVSVTFLVRARRNRRRQEQRFDTTVVGSVDKAIFHLDYQSERLKTFHGWFALPMALILILRLTRSDFQMADLTGLVTIQVLMTYVISILLCYAAIWFERQHQSSPERKSLLDIREKLVDASK